LEDENKKINRPFDLFAFCCLNHSDDFTREGNSIRFKDKKRITIKAHYQGWKDWSNEKTGNGFQFLTKFLGYTSELAVEIMSNFEVPKDFYNSSSVEILKEKSFDKPESCPDNDKAISYLCGRGLNPDIIQMAIDRGILYQTPYKGLYNIVFFSLDKDYAEIHGTMNKSFKRKATGSRTDGFWWFCPLSGDIKNIKDKTKKVYICEAAIDCLSLYQLIIECAVYISIGGAGCQSAIDRLKRFFWGIGTEIVLAVDNDKAGNECRNRNKDLKSIIPTRKDWNEDLQYSNRRYVT